MIGIIDSGFGGLTVVEQLHKQNVQTPFVFLGDNINIPYGTKTQAEIVTLATKMIDYLISHYQIDTLIIACNTICAAGLPFFYDNYPRLNIISIVDHGVASANMSFNEHVTVIATAFTVKTHIYQQKIQALFPEIAVQELVGTNWVEMVETNTINAETLENVLKDINPQTDLLILGCTHYPFLYSEIKKLINSSIQIINPAASCVALTPFDTLADWSKQSFFLTTGDANELENFLTIKGLNPQNIVVEPIQL